MSEEGEAARFFLDARGDVAGSGAQPVIGAFSII